MPRSKQNLAGGMRLSDSLAINFIQTIIPMEIIKKSLEENKKGTIRQRKLPRELLCYYEITLPLYSGTNINAALECMTSNLPEYKDIRCCQSAISQGRERLGDQVMKTIFKKVCKPMATQATNGAWYKGYRLVAIDGSDFDLADEKDIKTKFPKHGNGVEYPYPKLQFNALIELGTRAIFAVAMGNDEDSEMKLALQVIPELKKDMLLLGDRYYMGYDFYTQVLATGASVLLRARQNFNFNDRHSLPDGSYLATIQKNHSKKETTTVRVIEFKVHEKVSGKETTIRLVTNILDSGKAPALELAQLYCRRWGIETGFKEIKDSLKLPNVVLRSKTAQLVKQEFWGYMIAHYIIRSVIHQAALAQQIPPEDISFSYTISIIHDSVLGRVFSPKRKKNKGNNQESSR